MDNLLKTIERPSQRLGESLQTSCDGLHSDLFPRRHARKDAIQMCPPFVEGCSALC